MCEEEVSQLAEESPVDATLNAKEDALLEEWVNHRFEWTEVADKIECEKILAKLITQQTQFSRMEVEQFCQHIDVCRWFSEFGLKMYPSISKLVRLAGTWLFNRISRACVFEVSFVMSPLLTRSEHGGSRYCTITGLSSIARRRESERYGRRPC